MYIVSITSSFQLSICS